LNRTDDSLLGRNYLNGGADDAMNAILAAAGHNLRIILRKLRLSWLFFWLELLRDLRLTAPAIAAT
jgi:IS5 family transposase